MSNKRKISKLRNTVQILNEHNHWRRGAVGFEMTDTAKLGLAIDHAISVLIQVENLIAQKERHNTEISYVELVMKAEGK